MLFHSAHSLILLSSVSLRSNKAAMFITGIVYGGIFAFVVIIETSARKYGKRIAAVFAFINSEFSENSQLSKRNTPATLTLIESIFVFINN